MGGEDWETRWVRSRARPRFANRNRYLISVVGDSGTDITGTTDITGLVPTRAVACRS